MLRVKDIRTMFKDAYRAQQFTTDRTGVKTIEIIGATFLADEDYIVREPNYDYIVRELEWYESKSRNVNDIPGVVPAIWQSIATKDGMINSNYGWCVWSDENFNQYENVLKELRANPDSRRATMIYNRPSMHQDFNRDGMNDFMCFPGNTLVLSPEGDITIKELVHKIEQGEKYPVYSVNFETEEREIKYAVNGAKTGKKEIIRVHFDNGKYIDSTPDHRFYVRERHHSGKQYYYTYDNEVKAIDLKPGMSMINSLIYKNGKDHLRFKKLLKGEFSYSNSTIVHREYYKFHNPNENIDNMDVALQNCKVSFVEKLYIEQDVYDIEVEDNHNFFVGWKDDISGVGNGVLVHNCTFANSFFIRDNKLISHFIMRSTDAVFGFNNDVAWAMYVQKKLARDLEVLPGNLIWTSANIHVYERHFSALEKMIETL